MLSGLRFDFSFTVFEIPWCRGIYAVVKVRYVENYPPSMVEVNTLEACSSLAHVTPQYLYLDVIQ